MKRKRVNWMFLIECNVDLYLGFQKWLSSKVRRIKSTNRLGYLYLKTIYSTADITWMRNHYSWLVDPDQANVIRILRTPWIKLPEE